MMAVPSLNANAAVTPCPVGPRTPISIRRYPAASAASTVPSPPSATGTRTTESARDRPTLASPVFRCSATSAEVSVPLNLSGASATRLIVQVSPIGARPDHRTRTLLLEQPVLLEWLALDAQGPIIHAQAAVSNGFCSWVRALSPP